MRTFLSASGAPSSLIARRRESTKCSSPWESVSNLVFVQFDDIKHAFWWGWKVLKVVTQLDHQNNKDYEFHDNCHSPHPTLIQLELRICLLKIYICLWEIYINLTQLWPSVDHISDCFPIIIVWVETGKQKNNKSILIPWVQNVIYVVNNPEIPFVHLPRQLKKDNCSYNGRKLGFSEKNN